MRLLPALLLAGCAVAQFPVKVQPEAARRVVLNALATEKQPKPARLRLIVVKFGEDVQVIPSVGVANAGDETVVLLLPSQLHMGRAWEAVGKNELKPLTNSITFAGGAIPGSGNQYQAFVCAAPDVTKTIKFQLLAPGKMQAVKMTAIRVDP
jgi:hypothetical protein